jgi:hypothetical protein
LQKKFDKEETRLEFLQENNLMPSVHSANTTGIISPKTPPKLTKEKKSVQTEKIIRKESKMERSFHRSPEDSKLSIQLTGE